MLRSRHSGVAVLSLAALAALASPAEAVSPAQLQAALSSSGTADVQPFYRYAGHRPLWTIAGSLRPEALRVVELLRSAPLDGMAEGPERARRLQQLLDRARSGNPEALVRAELALSSAWAAYVQALRRPVQAGITYIDPNLAPVAPSPRSVLEAAARAPSLGRHMDEVSRINPIYAELRKGLSAWQERWAGLPRVTIPDGPAIAPGATGKRVDLLRTRLGLAAPGAFDAELAAAVRAFKLAHGLQATPQADAETLAALNTSPALVEQRIRANLDRARSLPASGRFVVVDAAAARLWLYEDGQPRDSMKVIVGKPGEPTPLLAGLIRTAVLNPYWNVPPDLVQRRVAPGVIKDGVGYLRSKRYEVLSDWSDQAKPVDPLSVDWAAVAAGRKEVRVRQLPGAANAMGRMKFMFPNDYGVYLHDTPEKDLFAASDRSQSSGCVRVEDAPRLARWLFGDVPRAESGKAEQVVALPQPVPLYITYFTAGWDGENFALRDDPYRRDTGSPAVSPRRLAGR
jgi:murein L,D-transpeptidase YcbB/YkuD